MMSSLPSGVVAQLTVLVQGLDDGLQSECHKVDMAMAVTEAFDQSYVGGPLLRALVCSIGAEVAAEARIPFVELANGGCEATFVHDGLERRFRLRKATFDGRGFLDIKVSSDSFLSARARGVNRTLFEQGTDVQSDTMEQWVLAYVLDPATRTLRRVYAAFPIGLEGHSKPFRLTFSDVVSIPLTAPTPPRFPSSNDDLDLEDDENEEGEDSGEAA